MSKLQFVDDLQALINKHSMENGSNTPDFLLAEYLIRCLDSFEAISNAREVWFGRNPAETTPISESDTGEMRGGDV